MYIDASFFLCDHLNPGFGYNLHIFDSTNGVTLLFTSKKSNGKDLLTSQDCINRIQDFLNETAN